MNDTRDPRIVWEGALVPEDVLQEAGSGAMSPRPAGERHWPRAILV